jgi:hypothetical protein
MKRLRVYVDISVFGGYFITRDDVIVSWNFKHLVSPDRIRRFNEINIIQG